MDTRKAGRTKAAKANRSESFHLHVVGYTWQGFKSAYSYTVDTPPKNIREAKQYAGDFESLTDFSVFRVVRGGSWDYDWTRRTVIKEWDDPTSIDTFAEAQP
jgi:hypothetical protein